MRDLFRVKLIGVVAVSTLGLYDVPRAAQRSASAPSRAPVPLEVASLQSSPTIPPQFAGVWDYNPQESINIVTGRPEQAPRSATQGGRAAGPPARVGGGQGTGGGGRGAGGFGGATGFGAAPPSNGLGLGPTPEMMREQRDMSRDLLEVPETYRIALGPTDITFVDDIERERTYTIGGRKQKYQLGASEFNARVEWTGTELRKEIEGALGFRMTEVYFLSPDGRRLFVMIRVGQANRNRQPTGYNRVYDRVEPAPADTARAN